MPVATVDINETHHKDLKSLEGGFVVLRRLPYGEWLTRQEMAMKMKIASGTEGETESEFTIINRKVTEFEFKSCLVDHNLEDANGNKLDFRSPATLAQLNPRVGNEISALIAELHEFEKQLGNSL